MMDNFSKTILKLAAVFAAISFVLFCGSRLYTRFTPTDKKNTVGNVEYTFYDEINWIIIDAGAADIYLQTHTGISFGCRMENISISTCEAYVENDTLRITERDPSSAVILGHNIGNSLKTEDRARIYLYVPDQTIERLKIDLGLGSIRINRLQTAETIMQLGAVSLTADNLSIRQNADIRLSAGTVSIQSLAAYNFKLSNAFGTVSINMDSDTDADSNPVSFKLTGAIKKFSPNNKTFDVSVGVGNIYINKN